MNRIIGYLLGARMTNDEFVISYSSHRLTYATVRSYSLYIALLVACAILFLANGSVRAASGGYATQLSRECDELMALAVRRPYGWAWTVNVPDPKPKGGAQPVTFDPAGTPAAGLVLYWAGDLLDQPKYKEAAFQAARGIVGSQRQLGQFPTKPIFLAANAGGRDDVALVADRASTRACLGLLLTLVDETGGKDDPFRRSAARAVLWMMKQQAATGAWPQAYPPDALPADAVRLARLDTPDWRDCTLAMLLATDVLKEKPSEAAARRAIDVLLKMRVILRPGNRPLLWSTAYGLDGMPTERIFDYPDGLDVLASRNAMQILLGGYLVLGEIQPDPQNGPQAGQSLLDAADAITKLPKRGGQWVRVYEYLPANTETPSAPSTSPFAATQALIPPHLRTGDWGMSSMLTQIGAINDVGRDKLIARLGRKLSIHQRLAATICGVEDDPFSIDWPTSDDQIPAYLKSHGEMPGALDKWPPTDLSERVHRIWWLIGRVKLEKHGG